jgi:hypothetical protein
VRVADEVDGHGGTIVGTAVAAVAASTFETCV